MEVFHGDRVERTEARDGAGDNEHFRKYVGRGKGPRFVTRKAFRAKAGRPDDAIQDDVAAWWAALGNLIKVWKAAAKRTTAEGRRQTRSCALNFRSQGEIAVAHGDRPLQ